MPNVPACVDPTDTATVRVCAMLRGKTGRSIWLDIQSLHWAVSFAADELTWHCGVPMQHWHGISFHGAAFLKPNFPDVPGIWQSYDHRCKLICFEFVEDVPNLPAGNLHLRRCMPIAALTDDVCKTFSRLPYNTDAQKRAVGLEIMAAWCDAILTGREDVFLATHKFLHMTCADQQEQTAASAQAANGVTFSATEQPVVDELAIGEYIVTGGMCGTPIDYGDVAQDCEHGTDAAAADSDEREHGTDAEATDAWSS